MLSLKRQRFPCQASLFTSWTTRLSGQAYFSVKRLRENIMLCGWFLQKGQNDWYISTIRWMGPCIVTLFAKTWLGLPPWQWYKQMGQKTRKWYYFWISLASLQISRSAIWIRIWSRTTRNILPLTLLTEAAIPSIETKLTFSSCHCDKNYRHLSSFQVRHIFWLPNTYWSHCNSNSHKQILMSFSRIIYSDSGKRWMWFIVSSLLNYILFMLQFLFLKLLFLSTLDICSIINK